MSASWLRSSIAAVMGAYAAWPSMTAKGLYKMDDSARVAEWVKGLARSGNQGPYGQARIIESVFPPAEGGAMKSPLAQPYGNDWAIVSGGSFTDLVIDSIFGANLRLSHEIEIHSRLADFDSEAELRNLNCQGKTYTINRHGAREVGSAALQGGMPGVTSLCDNRASASRPAGKCFQIVSFRAERGISL